MKKHYLSIFLTAFLGLNLFALDILAQNCTQLSLPENAIARLCKTDGGVTEDLDFSPDGKTLASVIHWPRQIILWDIENKTDKLTINDVNGQSVRYSPDGKTLVCGDVVYDAITGEPKLLLLDGNGYRDYVIFSPDGETLVGAGPKGIRFWNATIEKPPEDALPVGDTPINVLPTDTSTVETPEASPTSIPFATSSTTVPGISGLSYSPDGKELAIACNLGIWIYNPELNKEVTLLNAVKGGHSSSVVSVTYSPDGTTLVSVGDGIRLWNAKTKEHNITLSNPKVPGATLYPHVLSRPITFLSKSNIFFLRPGMEYTFMIV